MQPPAKGFKANGFKKVNLGKPKAANGNGSKTKKPMGKILCDLPKTGEAPSLSLPEKTNPEPNDVPQRHGLDSVIESFRKAVCDLQQAKRQMMESSEKAVLSLAMAIAKKVVQSEIEHNPDLTLAIIRKTLQKIKNTDKLCIKVNPNDLQKVRNSKNALLEVSGQEVQISIEPENTVSRGGCLIETDMGDFDARLESQIQLVEQAILLPSENILSEGDSD
jgi:flagellar biosynthesis/type III secretory pathway protein FliH